MTTASTLSSPGPTLGGASAGQAAPLAVGGAGQAHDQRLVADAKQEIRALVEEIARLATQDIPPEEFYAGFLPRVVSAMAAAGGIVWTIGPSGRLKLQLQVGSVETNSDRSPESKARHGQLLKKVLADSQALLVPPTTTGAEHQPGNPTGHLLVVAPLLVEKEPQGIVEIFQRAGSGPTTQRGYLRFLVQMCDVASDYLKSRRLRQLAQNQTLWQQLEGLVEELHHSLDLRETSYAVVNEGRRLIGCDRVSLALITAGRCQIEAVSGLDSIDRRASEVQLLAKLAQAVLQVGEAYWSDADEDELPPQIQAPLIEYVDRSQARLVGVLPLSSIRGKQHSPEATGSDHEDETNSRRSFVGALIVEQFREQKAAPALRVAADLVAKHSALALTNARQHHEIFLLPLWQALGRASWIIRARTLPKTILALALVALAAGSLAVIPANFDVAARGKLQPSERREVFAPLDGIVASVPVEHGQLVEPGTILAELTSTDLDLALAALIGRQTTNQERLAALQRTLLDKRSGSARLSPLDENRLAGEQSELKQEAENIERELALLGEKQNQLIVKAPQRGQVVTWKVRELLLARPVSRGQALLTLANPDGPWELELYLPERRLKHVLKSASGRRAPPAQPVVPPGITASRANSTDIASPSEASSYRDAYASRSPLAATFVLSSHPGATFHGQVVEIEQSAEVRGDEGNTVLVRVAVDKAALPALHDQTTVTAKLHCGQTSIGYAWFCDLIETFQTKVAFWLPW